MIKVDESEVEMIDLEIDANNVVSSMLENRIKELELIIEENKIIQSLLQEEIVTEIKFDLPAGWTYTDTDGIAVVVGNTITINMTGSPDLSGFLLTPACVRTIPLLENFGW